MARAPPLDQYRPQDGSRHSHNQEHHACSTHHAKIHIHRGSSLKDIPELGMWGASGLLRTADRADPAVVAEPGAASIANAKNRPESRS